MSGEPRAGAFYGTAVGCEKNAIVLDAPGTEHGDIRGVGHERSVKTCEPLVNLKIFSWKPRIEEPTTIIPHMYRQIWWSSALWLLLIVLLIVRMQIPLDSHIQWRQRPD